VPPLAYGLYWMVKHQEILGVGLWFVAAAPVLAWIALNFLGLFENGRMRRELVRELGAREEPVPADAVFVGFASPRFHGLLDAHEDVGFLVLKPDAVEFRSETRTVRLLRRDVVRVRFRFNVHTLVGLGRWVSIEGLAEKRPFRLLVEPREKSALLANLLSSRALRERVEAWQKETGPGPKPGAV
jgi:hypothetical protein